MKEFGSDFHRCDHDFRGASNYLDELGDVRFYASGRHALDAIVKFGGWKRIWMPAYFCYEIIGHIKSTGIDVELYDDCPLNDRDNEVVRNLPYKKGDVLLRTDYFGMRERRINEGVCVPVIEDHTHGLITAWALKSDADWCIASLRKSLPVAAGGILWSPKNKALPQRLQPSAECMEMAKIRYKAMDMKAAYLKTQYASNEEDNQAKDDFRRKFIQSEEMIENLVMSGIDPESEEIVRGLNIKQWTDLKSDNWRILVKMLDKRFRVLGSERGDYWHPFSLVLLMESAEEREALRKYMVQHKIYPAILWRMPENSGFAEAKDFSERMLSVHCDIRYNREAIVDMCKILNSFYD